MYECDNCGDIGQTHNHEGDDMPWCLRCLENEQEECLNAEISERLCTAGLAHVFESDDTMVLEVA